MTYLSVLLCFISEYMSKITGIILAGGKSRRMGAEKGLLRLGSKFMIELAIEALKPMCDQIIISENTDAYDFLEYKVVPDYIPNSGPMGGIYSALRESENDLNIVLSCDMPFISTDLLKTLLDRIEKNLIAVHWHGGRKFEPMCAVYSKELLPVLEKFINENNYRIPDVFDVVPTSKVEMNDQTLGFSDKSFENVNSEKELEKAAQYFDKKLPQMNSLMLIAGSGRNVGKTSLVCKLIDEKKSQTDLIAIKVSPHIHEEQDEKSKLFSGQGYAVYEEFDPNGSKDSSKMLKAGAKRVFYIQADDRRVGEAFSKLKEILPKLPIIAESGGLRHYYRPGLFLMCHKDDTEITKEKSLVLLPKVNQIVHFENDSYENDIKSVVLKNGNWSINY
ncbi:MAG: hypothetical protein CL663_06160 [Bacteroidetes bacterium]|nr:hypothetical protein [Bacteroidota bacterium]